MTKPTNKKELSKSKKSNSPIPFSIKVQLLVQRYELIMQSICII